MARLHISLLGPFQVTLDGQLVTQFKSNKVRALLAYLAAEAERPHDRDVLAGLLWPEWPNRAARNNLRYALSDLRKAIGDRDADPPFLLISRATIQFNAASDHELDLAAIVDLPATELGSSAIDRLRAAVDRYQGRFIDGFSLPDSAPFEEWITLKREQIGRTMMLALQRLAEDHAGRGEYEQACRYVRQQIEREPWQEEAHRHLMRLLASSGQRSAALAQFDTCRRLLAEELSVDPSDGTTELYQQIRDGEWEVCAPPRDTPSRPSHNLPTSLVPFVGREVELADIASRLQDPTCRLLTLVGAGGSGKTRLAVEASAAQVDRYPDGVWFVPLAPLQSVQAIVSATSQVLRLPSLGDADPRRQLLGFLRGKSMLLILDNFEHLLEGAPTVADILQAAADVQILTTSRVRLGVQGEHLFSVGGMERPTRAQTGEGAVDLQDLRRYSAVQLFLQSAARAQPSFAPSASDMEHVARICELVDGMPLGILLAAAWTEMLSPAEIAGEIEKSLDFLETEWRDVPEAQRSLRAVFDRSWGLLSEREQEIFEALSVFRGGFTREAAHEVGGASLRDLKALVAKSFLEAVPGWSRLRGAWTRYETHDLLRQYAAEKLAQSESACTAAHDRHSAYYASVLERWAADLKGSRQQEALAESEPEHDNLRVAWDWAIEQSDVALLAQGMEGLMLCYWLGGRYAQGAAPMGAVAGALALPLQTPAEGIAWILRLQARALVWQSNFLRAQGLTERALQLQQQAQELLSRPELADLDTQFEQALVRQMEARTIIWSDYTRARGLLEEALATYLELDDLWRAANVMEALGRAAFAPGDAEQARHWLEKSLALCRSIGNESGACRSMAWLSRVSIHQGRFEEAERQARWVADTFRGHDNGAELSFGLGLLGESLCLSGLYDSAQTVLDELLGIWGDWGRPDYTAYERAYRAVVSLHLGRYEEAERYAQVATTAGRETGMEVAIGVGLSVLGCLALARRAYAEARGLLQEAAATLRGVHLVAELSQTESLLAWAARGEVDRDRAEKHLLQALRLAQECGAVPSLIWALPVAALLLADRGDVERAVEIDALASCYDIVANSKWFEEVAGRPIAEVADGLPAEVEAAAQEWGRARDLEGTVEELLAQFGG